METGLNMSVIIIIGLACFGLSYIAGKAHNIGNDFSNVILQALQKTQLREYRRAPKTADKQYWFNVLGVVIGFASSMAVTMFVSNWAGGLASNLEAQAGVTGLQLIIQAATIVLYILAVSNLGTYLRMSNATWKEFQSELTEDCVIN